MTRKDYEQAFDAERFRARIEKLVTVKVVR